MEPIDQLKVGIMQSSVLVRHSSPALSWLTSLLVITLTIADQTNMFFQILPRVAEVVRGHGRPRQKVWTRTKIFSLNIRYFVANSDLLQFTHFLEIFGQVPYWVKNSVSWARSALLHGIIAYFTELILQICCYAQKRRI